MKWTHSFLFIIVVGVLCSCASTKGSGVPKTEGVPTTEGVPKTATVSFQKDAVSLDILSDKQLNLYHASPHSLTLCVYQLSEPNGFIQLADEKDGAAKLMECARFDGSVANAKRVIVHPGQDMSDVGDRAEGTRYIGIIAGYYEAKTDRIVQIFTIPASFAKSSSKGLPLVLTLGPKGILGLKVKE
jgi:type VI secretion system VasD/TssJ family lipoprotein